jgi:multidrug efflux system outer membrane protein
VKPTLSQPHSLTRTASRAARHARLANRPGSLAAAVGVAAWLGGCAIEPPDIAVPIPTSYRAQRGGPSGVVPEDWVRGFGSAELNRLVAGTLQGNLDLEAALARIQQAQAQSVIASSALFPIISGSADASRQRSSGSRSTSTGTGTGLSGTAFNTYSLGLNASYNIDLFGQNRFAALAAGDTARATRYDRDNIALSTVASVANTYFNVLSAQDRLRIARDNLAISQRLLDAIRGRLTVGTATALDIAQQESVVAGVRATVPPLEQQLAQNKNVLAVLLGRTPESVAIRGGSLDALTVPRVTPGLPAELLLRRPDVAEQEAYLESASASVASARAAFFPSIQLTASTGFTSTALRTLLGPGGLGYSVAAGLTQPILDGYRLQGELDLQKGRAAEFAATYRKAIIQAFSDVENALVAVQRTSERERLQREAVAASRRALEITEQRLREGTIDLVTLFNIQTTLFSSQDLLVQVRLERFQAYVSLYQALGGGWSQARAIPRRLSITEVSVATP